MIEELDAYRAAKLMVEKYGQQAHARATLRLKEAVDQENFAAAFAWRSIQQAIEELQRDRRDDEALN